MSIISNENRLKLAGASILALSSGLSLGKTLQRATLPPDSQELYENQVENVAQRLGTLVLSTLVLLGESEKLGELFDKKSFMASLVIGAGAHLGIHAYLSSMKAKDLTNSIGESSRELTSPDEYTPPTPRSPSSDSGSSDTSIFLSYRRDEKRALPSYLDSLLRSTHTISSIALLATTPGTLPLLIGTSAIGINIADQLLQPWATGVKLDAHVSIGTQANRSIPIPENDENIQGDVIQPMYSVELGGKLVGQRDCQDCGKKRVYTVHSSKENVCTPCLKKRIVDCVENMIQDPSRKVTSFKKAPETEDLETITPPYLLQIEVSKVPLKQSGISILSISGIGPTSGVSKRGNAKIVVALKESPQVQKNESSFEFLPDD